MTQRSPLAWGLRWLVRSYQVLLSPLKGPPSCRFYPSCSAYAVEALELHGGIKGSWLTLRRVLRCHPFHPGGSDPVPSKGDPHC